MNTAKAPGFLCTNLFKEIFETFFETTFEENFDAQKIYKRIILNIFSENLIKKFLQNLYPIVSRIL